MTEIQRQAKLIEGLASTMDDRMRPEDVIQRCAMIIEAAQKLQREASNRIGGSR